MRGCCAVRDRPRVVSHDRGRVTKRPKKGRGDAAPPEVAASLAKGWTPWLWANNEFKFEPVTADQVAAMLVKAGAKKPWIAPELCNHIAKGLTLAKQFVEPNRRVEPTIEHRVWPKQKALLDELPALRAQWQFNVHHDEIDRIRGEQLAKLDAIEAALKAYFVSPPPAGETIEGSWHDHAIKLWALYVMLVGDGSTSKNGPAVRFVQMALLMIGWSALERRTGHTVPPNAASIETALLRGGCVSVPRAARQAKAKKDNKSP